MMSELDVVENLAVADQYQRPVLVVNGLHSIVQAYDAKPAETHRHIIEEQEFLCIRAPVQQFAVHFLDDAPVMVVNIPGILYETAYSTHKDCFNASDKIPM